MNSYRKQTMIGPLPPPLGGIAVYLDRLRRICPEDEYISENNMSVFKWLYHCLRRNRLLAYHSPNIRRIISLVLIKALTDNRYCLYIHGTMLIDNYLAGNILLRLLLKMTVQQAENVYVLNRRAYDFFTKTMGVSRKKIIFFSSYLPPPLGSESAIIDSYGEATRAFVREHSPLLIVNASRLTFYQGVDLYGVDMCVELLAKISGGLPKVGLVVAIAEIGDHRYYQSLQSEIARKGLREAIHFLTGNKEIWPLFRKANLLLRPTVTDGYSISLREAMQFDCRTVASDACERPDDTIIFKSRDGDALYEAVLVALGSEGR